MFFIVLEEGGYIINKLRKKKKIRLHTPALHVA
jgi:hypothetical protein